jgi:AraC family transcriptional regulator
MDVLVNPAAALLGTTNAVLSGRSARYESRFTGPLSIKSVICGSATWETAQGRFEVVPGCALLVNDGEEYSIAVDGLQPVETFCLFFERGFVEDAWRATTMSSTALLESPSESVRIAFSERLQFDAPLVGAMRAAHARMQRGEPLAESFAEAALEVVRTRIDVEARVARLPALRAATREELARRVEIATSFLHANLDRRVSIAEAAREACLSPFHFHRLFTAFHGTTPHRYLTRLRLDLAHTLLRASDRPVAEVAQACGFESVGTFTTLFTKAFGAPPARYRRADSQDRRSAREAGSATIAS